MFNVQKTLTILWLKCSLTGLWLSTGDHVYTDLKYDKKEDYFKHLNIYIDKILL